MSNPILVPACSHQEANNSTDVTARLHNYLVKCPSSHITHSPSSATTDTTIPEKGCGHDRIITQGNYDTCFYCGVYMPKNGVKSFKSKNMNFTTFFPTKTIYETMIRQSHRFQSSANPEYAQTRLIYIEWILELSEKFYISPNTSHLSVYLLDIIMFKNPAINSKVKLFASICLLIAAKIGELDDKIPYIPKLRRYGDSRYSIDDYRQAELQALDLLDWNPQLSSAVQITEFLLTQGVLFSSDEIEENKKLGETPKASPKIFTEIKPSPKPPQDIFESYFSEVSTTGTLTDGLGTPQSSPMSHMIPGFFKHPSIERQGSMRVGIPIEKRVDEILNHIEGNYIRLCNLIIQDIDLIEWEPKIAAAAAIAFFRRINNISPIWNVELEIITCLKFSQIAVCHELLFRKFNSTFNLHLFKIQNNIEIPEQKQQVSSSEVKMPLTSPIISHDKTPTSRTNFELNNKQNPSDPSHSTASTHMILAEKDQNVVTKPPTERKSIFTYPIQTKDSRTSVLESYDFLRDQLFCKLNREKEAEAISRNTIKNSIFSENYMPSRFAAKNQENKSDIVGVPSFGISSVKDQSGRIAGERVII